MKKGFILLVMIISILSVNSLIQAQTVDEIIFRHLDAVGQRDLLKKQTYMSEATVEQMGMEIPMRMKVKRPGKFKMEIEMQGQKMVQAFDGEKGWMIAPWVGPEPNEVKGEELREMREQANLDGELHNYAQKGKQATLIGKEDIDGKPMWNVKLDGMDGTVKNYYIDAVDFLIKKVKVKLRTQYEKMEMEQNILEYKNIDGIRMPSKIESISPRGKAIITFNEISFNKDIEDSEFSMPTN